jgi:phage anti-repressor protein
MANKAKPSSELIPIVETSLNGELTRTCNARDLHAFLDVKRRFASWIQERITKYDFVDNVDYIKVFPESGKNPLGGRPEQEYHLTIEMAKELAMVENNERGKEARRYFIEQERIARGVVAQRAIDLTAFERRLSQLETTVSTLPTRSIPGLDYELDPNANFKMRILWFTPTDFSEIFKITPSKIGSFLKLANCHGEQDADHVYSEPYLRGRGRELAYKYNPLVVLPALKKIIAEFRG